MKLRITFLIVIILSSCYGGFRYWRTKIDIPLEDQKENIEKLSLGTDGLWVDTANSNLLVLFTNGVILNYVFKGASTEELLEFYSSDSTINSFNKKLCWSPVGWGVYNIDGKEIKMERWVGVGMDKYHILKFGGRIIDGDIIRVQMVENKKLFGTEDDRYSYTFFPIENKPDSCMRWFE